MCELMIGSKVALDGNLASVVVYICLTGLYHDIF